jgi:hypothetical protein
MNQAEAYTVTVEEQEIVIRFSRTLADYEALSKLLDYIAMQSIRERSALSVVDGYNLASEIDRDIWERNKQKYMEK